MKAEEIDAKREELLTELMEKQERITAFYQAARDLRAYIDSFCNEILDTGIDEAELLAVVCSGDTLQNACQIAAGNAEAVANKKAQAGKPKSRSRKRAPANDETAFSAPHPPLTNAEAEVVEISE